MVTANYAALVARQRAEVTDGLFSAARRLRWSADRLAAERERRLRELLSWSVERSTFHAERLGDIDANRFTEADLPSLPIMTKADLMDNFDEAITDPALTLGLVNTHVDELDDDDYLLNQYRVIATSGSTGARGLFVYGWEDWTTFVLIATRWGQGADSLPFNASVGTLFASNTKHVSGALHAFFRDLTGNGATPVTHLPVTLPLPEIVAGLNAAQPVVLQGYPSAMHLLALGPRLVASRSALGGSRRAVSNVPTRHARLSPTPGESRSTTSGGAQKACTPSRVTPATPCTCLMTSPSSSRSTNTATSWRPANRRTRSS